MVDFEKVIYDEIWREYGDGSQFLWEDIVGDDFEEPSKAASPSVEAKRQKLQSAVDIGQRQVIGGYLAGAVKGFRKGGGMSMGDLAYTSYAGTAEGVLYDVFSTDTSEQHIPLSRREAAPAAAKAHRLGLKKAYVAKFGRGDQSWDWYEVTNITDGPEDYLRARMVEPSPGPVNLEVRAYPALTAILDKYLMDLSYAPNTRKSHCIHPSEISISSCDRRIAYSLMGTEGVDIIQPSLRRIFDVGNVYHDVVQTSLGWRYPNFKPEIHAAHKDLKIYGHCDGSLDHEGIEIKSMSSAQFVKLSRPKSDHLVQGTIYAATVGLDFMTYIYINKATAEIKTYKLPVDRQLWHTVAKRAASIVAAVKSGELPPPIEGKDGTCFRCKYQATCKPELSVQTFRGFR